MSYCTVLGYNKYHRLLVGVSVVLFCLRFSPLFCTYVETYTLLLAVVELI
jgi:hypothetical protein